MAKAQQDYYRIHNKQRDLEFFSMALSMIGLSIAIYNYECDVTEHTKPITLKEYPIAM